MIKLKTEIKKSSNLKDSLMIFIGLLISIIFLWLLLRNIQFNLVLVSLKSIQLQFIIFSIMSIIFSALARSKAWQIILDKRISFLRSFQSVNEGQMLNTLLPLRMGDLARALFTSQNSKIKLFDLLATIIVERIYDVLIMLVLLLISFPFVFNEVDLFRTLLITSVLIFVGVIFIFILIFSVDWVKNVWHSIFVKISFVDEWGQEKLDEVSLSLQVLRNLRSFLKISFWMILTWFFALISIWVLLKGFFPEVALVMPFFLQGVSGLGVSIPSSPGSIGVYEATMVFGLGAFGVDESTAFAFGILHHFISVLPVVFIGIVSMVLDGQGLFGWFDKLRFVREKEK